VTAPWEIVPLDRSHDRTTFHCGKPTLDDFIRTLVSQYEKRNLGKTYVAVPPGEQKVLGYYTLASGAITFENLPTGTGKKLPRHPVPVILLARLAVDQSMQGLGLGRTLLIDALLRCVKLSEKLGVHAVEVHAIDEAALRFYEQFGFIALLDSPLHLYLPIATIRAGFGPH
jgi:GNAT superfamily N-acetyltransferase